MTVHVLCAYNKIENPMCVVELPSINQEDSIVVFTMNHPVVGP